MRNGHAPDDLSFRRRLSLWAVHHVIRVMMTGYALLMCGAKLVGPEKRHLGDGYREILLTGTFYSDNWIVSHLRPLALSRHCAHIRVVCTQPIPPIEKVEVIFPPQWLVRLMGTVLARLVTFIWSGLRLRPHLVGGFHLLFNGLAAAFLGRLTGARSMYFCVGGPAEVRGGGFATENRLFERLKAPDSAIERQLLRAVGNFDLVITMGTRAVQFFHDHGVNTMFHVVSGGLDASHYIPATNPASVDLIFVGRLVPIKRIDLFLQTIKQLRDKALQVSAVVTGDGQLRESLEKLAKDLGIKQNVRFVGHQRDIAAWLRCAKIFVLTSDSEGLSLALIEAMLCGLPAVVPCVGDLGDLVEHGVNGYLVTEHSPEAFATRIAELLTDSQRLAQFSHAARRSAKRYELGACIERWNNILAPQALPVQDARPR